MRCESKNLIALTPYDNFVYALKAKETKRQYPHRLDKFLLMLDLKEQLKKNAVNYMKLGKC